MDETIYVIFKVQFAFALEVWFSIDMNFQNNLIQFILICEKALTFISNDS